MKDYEATHNVSLPFFFHDGESTSRNNTNLFDAVMLDSRRIGHGFNLYYFPVLFPIIKERNIAIEVNPISNNVLRYNSGSFAIHPVTSYMASGLPVVISSDDGGVFGYTGLSNDFFASIVGFQLDLKQVKKLVFNSIEYSSLTKGEKERSAEILAKRWEDWVMKMLAAEAN